MADATAEPAKLQSIEARTPAATRALGQRLGKRLRARDVVLLSGELGAGKTVFTQGIAEGLGARGQVSSPSFVLMNEYQGRERLFHVDLYRIAEPEEAEYLGLEDYSEGGVLVVEWPERAPDYLPAEYLLVRIAYAPEGRLLALEPRGKRACELAAAIS
jgi:tRNA threonylcarbamoyladenosine biosynthesis protein TsaE